MATTKTLISNINSLVHNGIISDAEAAPMLKRVFKAERARIEAEIVETLVQSLREFMEADVQYKISDLVLGVLGIKAPCHGYAETAEERKFRDGTAKPRIIAALEILGASKYGSGAQTRYSFGEAAPEFEVNADNEEESAES